MISIIRFLFVCVCVQNSFGVSPQNQEVRLKCKKAQVLEADVAKLISEIQEFSQKEKTSAPVVKNIQEILTRCFTLLFDIQRFSKILALSQCDSKNDFVRCSIVIKNFASYFKSVGSQLGKNSTEIIELKKNKENKKNELKNKQKQYDELTTDISKSIMAVARKNDDNIIQNVVYHIATKVTSIEELDAELESENAVGVLKNVRISTELSLAYPVQGKIVTEFGDKGSNGEMIYYIAFESLPSAIVTSPVKGLAVFSGEFLNYGNIVIISNGDYRVFLYGMDTLFTKAGDVVEIGDYVGKMKNDSSKAPMVKMELRKCGMALDPRHWLLQTLEKEKK